MSMVDIAAGMVVGVGIFLAGMIAGRSDRRRRSNGPQEPICGCQHHLSKHDPETGECLEQVYYRANYKDHYRQCECRQYVGPEPISKIWVPPMRGD